MNYKLCLDFIRYSLNPKDELLKDGAEMDREEMFRFADEQGILGLMYDGRRKMDDVRGKMDDGRRVIRFVKERIAKAKAIKAN